LLSGNGSGRGRLLVTTRCAGGAWSGEVVDSERIMAAAPVLRRVSTATSPGSHMGVGAGLLRPVVQW